MKNDPIAISDTREVTIDGHDYRITRLPGVRRDGYVFASVELIGEWQVDVPLPEGVQELRGLWYRELIELVDRAWVLALDARMSA